MANYQFLSLVFRTGLSLVERQSSMVGHHSSLESVHTVEMAI